MKATYYQAAAKSGYQYFFTCGHKHRSLDRAYDCREKLQNFHGNLTIIVIDEEGNHVSYEPCYVPDYKFCEDEYVEAEHEFIYYEEGCCISSGEDWYEEGCCISSGEEWYEEARQ